MSSSKRIIHNRKSILSHVLHRFGWNRLIREGDIAQLEELLATSYELLGIAETGDIVNVNQSRWSGGSMHRCLPLPLNTQH